MPHPNSLASRPCARYPWMCRTAVSILVFSLFAVGSARAQDDRVPDLVKRSSPALVVIQSADRDGRSRGLGTGFFVTPDGLLATNLHVIGQGRPLEVRTADGRRLEVTHIHAFDRHYDLALVRCKVDEPVPCLALAEEETLDAGQAIVAIGHPMGLQNSVVRGAVSGRREIDGIEMIQLAIPIEPGNSGGPLLDLDGNVHGLVTMKSAVTANLGFATPVAFLRKLLEAPNPVPIDSWLRMGRIDQRRWEVHFGGDWRERSGRVMVSAAGDGFGGRSLCLAQTEPPEIPYAVSVWVKLDDESGAAGLAFLADEPNRHLGFYPSAGAMRLTRFEGPTVFQWKVLEQITSPAYRPGQWNHLRVEVLESEVVCYVNDHLVTRHAFPAWKSGRVGLAKFRDTRAEFRRFRVVSLSSDSESHEGTKTDEAEPSVAELAAALGWMTDTPEPQTAGQLWRRLTSAAGTGDDDVEATVADSARADQVAMHVDPDYLREQAGRLQRQALLLNQIARQRQIQIVCREIQQLAPDGDWSQIDLARGAMLISRLDNEDLEVQSYLDRLDQMADEIRERLEPDATAQQRLDAIRNYLFQENGFHGSRIDYDHQANNYLDRVIDDREGVPITLATLMMELGERLDVPLEGVGLPGHFVVRWRNGDEQPVLLDAYHGGQPLSREQAAERVRETAGVELLDEHLDTMQPRDILLRILHNLLRTAQRRDDRQAMLGYLEAMLALDPQLAPQRGMRAVLRFELGWRDEALADLEWLRERRSPDVDQEQVEWLYRRFREQMGGE